MGRTKVKGLWTTLIVWVVVCGLLFPAVSYAPTGWRPAVRSGVALRRSGRGLEEFGRGGNRVVLKAEEESSEAEPEEGDEDVTNSVVFLEKKIEVLESELDELDVKIEEAQAEAATEWEEWGPKIEQLKAEFDNVKKRESAARSAASSTELAEVLGQIFPVTDNFDLANAYIKPETDGQQSIADRYAQIQVTLDETFATLGVEAIDQVGVPFDPTFHTAAMFQPDPQHPEEHVSTILQRGFKVMDIVVRPATVVVSSGAG